MNDSGMDVLVDAARDVAGSLLSQVSVRGRATVDKWAVSPSPLLRRIAVNALVDFEEMSADDKVAWILERDLLYDAPTKHEVFRLLKSALPAADDESRRAVLTRAKRGLLARDNPRLDKRTREYERYNLLYWISQSIPNDPKVVEAFRLEQDRHPDFGPRSDPDMEITQPEFEHIPLERTALKGLESKKPDRETVEWLLSLMPSEDDPWHEGIGVVGAVSSAAKSNPAWGIDLARTLKRRRIPAGGLWVGLIHAWAESELPDQTWRQAFGTLIPVSREPRLALELSRLLVTYVQRLDSPEAPSLSAAERVSDEVWVAANGVESGVSGGPDWLTWSINHPGGKLAEFWLRALALSQTDGSPSKIPPALDKRLRKVVKGHGTAAEAGRVFLASQLHFLNNVDKEWAYRWIRPLFEWRTRGEHAERAWDGFLIWGRLNESVVELMLPLYEQSFSRLQNRPVEWRNRFTRHLALIAVRTARNPLRDGWLRKFVHDAPVDDRALWSRHVAFALRELDDQAGAIQWEKWISSYWEDRLRGVPKRLAKPEASEMYLWAVVVKAHFNDAVQLAIEGPGGPPQSLVYDFLVEGDFAEKEPLLSARFLARLLAEESEPFYSCHKVVGLFSVLKEKAIPESELQPVAEQAVRVGCTGILA